MKPGNSGLKLEFKFVGPSTHHCVKLINTRQNSSLYIYVHFQSKYILWKSRPCFLDWNHPLYIYFHYSAATLRSRLKTRTKFKLVELWPLNFKTFISEHVPWYALSLFMKIPQSIPINSENWIHMRNGGYTCKFLLPFNNGRQRLEEAALWLFNPFPKWEQLLRIFPRGRKSQYKLLISFLLSKVSPEIFWTLSEVFVHEKNPHDLM